MLLTCAQHVDRARYHRQAGEALHAVAGHQWAAVCYFYSAFHLARAALSVDTVFYDLAALQQIHPGLAPDDRFATKHQMRRGSEKSFGVNDLVDLLYPDIGTSYRELHGASNGVRYGTGTNTPVDDLLAELVNVEKHLWNHARLLDLKAELERVRT